MRTRVAEASDTILRRLERPGHYGLTALAVAGVLLLEMAPVGWTDNEVNYFDLAHRFVSPDRFGPNHAVFDASVARFASFALMGGAVELLGHDAALIVLRLALVALLASTFAYMACSWALSAAETVVALILFLLVEQCYFADEWLFRGVEGKTFAYAAVFVAIGLAWRRRYHLAIGLLAFSTYFHFLVGGFWALAVFAFMGIRDGTLIRAGRFLLAYVLVVLPVVALLVWEQLRARMPETADLDLTPNQIYAVFRVPHHLAPFSTLEQFAGWLPGIAWMVAATGLLALLARRRSSEVGVPARWLLSLHLYLMAAFAVVFLDRQTNLLAPLYLFRPNSLMLLLTLMLGMLWLRQSLLGSGARALAVVMIAAVLGFAPPRAAALAHGALTEPRLPLERTMAPPDRELVDWLRLNTDPSDTVVLEPTPDTDWNLPWVAFERLIDRPTLISYKFAPTLQTEIVRWYRLIRWREAVFGGDCSRVAQYDVSYLVTVNPATLERMAGCGDTAWTNGTYGVLSVRRSARSLLSSPGPSAQLPREVSFTLAVDRRTRPN